MGGGRWLKKRTIEQVGEQCTMKQNSIKNFFPTINITESQNSWGWKGPLEITRHCVPEYQTGTMPFLRVGIWCHLLSSPLTVLKKSFRGRFSLSDPALQLVTIIRHSWRKVTETSGLGKWRCIQQGKKAKVLVWHYHMKQINTLLVQL